MGLIQRCAVPAAGVDDSRQGFVVFGVVAKQYAVVYAALIDRMDGDGRSGIEVPDFIGLNAVKGGKVATLSRK